MEYCDNEVVISIEPSESIQVIDLQPSIDVSTIGTIEDDTKIVVVGTQPDSAKTVCCDTLSSGGGGSVDFAEESLSARTLKISLIADENVSALKLIYQSSPTNGGLGNSQINAKKDVVGISVSAAVTGNLFEVLLFGRVEDAFFNYPVNTSLYLDIDGNITDISPTTGYSVLIGKGLGTGAIFIDIERPIIL